MEPTLSTRGMVRPSKGSYHTTSVLSEVGREMGVLWTSQGVGTNENTCSTLMWLHNVERKGDRVLRTGLGPTSNLTTTEDGPPCSPSIFGPDYPWGVGDPRDEYWRVSHGSETENTHAYDGRIDENHKSFQGKYKMRTFTLGESVEQSIRPVKSSMS